jgi:glycerol uptake facilitator-like aquaporin
MESTERGWPDAAQQQLMTHPQLTPNFLNPSLEWRRFFAEIWGTFLLVLVAAGGGVVGAMSNGKVTLGMMVSSLKRESFTAPVRFRHARVL